jgi:hypothetical protein
MFTEVTLGSLFYKVVNLGKLSSLSTTLDSDSGSDSALSGGSWYTKKTVVKLTSIFLLNGVPIREHFNNIHTFSQDNYQTVLPQPFVQKPVSGQGIHT